MTLRTPTLPWVMTATIAAFAAMGTVPAQSEDWAKVDGISYLEMPDKMYNSFFNTLSWCRASVETPEERLEHLRGGFPEEEAKEIITTLHIGIGLILLPVE